MVYSVVDLCAGTGALGKSFEETGLYEIVGAAENDPNHKALYKVNFGKTPLDDISENVIKEYIDKYVSFDVLLAGLNGLDESILDDILEIFISKRPKAMVLEFDISLLHQSLVKTCEIFCKNNGYYVTHETLNPFDFGIPSITRRTIFIAIKEDCFYNYDPDFFKINKSKKWKDYKDKEFDYDNLLQSRGFDWGFPKFKFLIGTPEWSKKTIMKEASFIPMMCSVAMDLSMWLK